METTVCRDVLQKVRREVNLVIVNSGFHLFLEIPLINNNASQI